MQRLGMHLTRLKVTDFRIIRDADLELGPGFNWLFGANGAGKTSLLESLAVLARGRSFRSTKLPGLIRTGAQVTRIVAHRAGSGTGGRVLGVERGAGQWSGRIDGKPVSRVSEFARQVPLVVFEPGSHALVDGPPDERRQFLDWTMFHVEPDYLAHWRDFARALKQRNAALRDHQPEPWVRALDEPLIRHGNCIDRWRRDLVAWLEAGVPALLAEVGIRVPVIELSYRSGWPAAMDFAGALEAGWTTDRERGFTGRGPQRGELEIRVDGRPAGGRLSRGQQKLVSLGLLLVQHRILAEHLGTTPVFLLDDPVSELDVDHLQRLLGWVSSQPAQVLITAVDRPGNPRAGCGNEKPARLFHVEQGCVQSVS